MAEADRFPSTRWTCIQRICSGDQAEARAAMEEVCRIYWRPLYEVAISMNLSHQDAEDITQGFLLRVSSEDFFDAVTPHKGKLRSYLFVALKRYIFDEWRKQASQKRGGKKNAVPLEESNIAANETPLSYDREWAKVVADDAKAKLRETYTEQNKAELFTAIESCLDGSPLGNYAHMGKDLGMSAVAMKSAVHRVRRRFGEEIRKAVAETVHDENDIEEEIRWLIQTLEG